MAFPNRVMEKVIPKVSMEAMEAFVQPSFIEEGCTDVAISSATVRATHIKQLIRIYATPTLLQPKTAFMLDSFLDVLDSAAKTAVRKNSNAVEKFKRECELSETGFFKLIHAFFNCEDLEEKKYLCAIVLQAAASLRVSNVLPSIKGDCDYVIGPTSFNFNVNKINPSMYTKDWQISLLNSKTGQLCQPFSRLGLWSVLYASIAYKKHPKWFSDLTYSKYSKILRKYAGNDTRTHDLRHVIPAFTARTFASQHYREQVNSYGNWRSERSTKIYTQESQFGLTAIYDAFVKFHAKHS